MGPLRLKYPGFAGLFGSKSHCEARLPMPRIPNRNP